LLASQGPGMTVILFGMSTNSIEFKDPKKFLIVGLEEPTIEKID